MFHRTITSNSIKLVTKYSWVRFVKVSPCPMENTSDNKTVKIRGNFPNSSPPDLELTNSILTKLGINIGLKKR